MNAFWVDLKKNILSPNFIISVLLMALLCLLADAPTVSAREPLSILDEIVKMRKEIWLEKGSEFSSISILYHFDNSIWFNIILPIIAAFTVVYHFSDEWFGDNYILTLYRSGYKKYTFAKFSSAFITGFLVALTGIFLFGLVVFGIFPSLREFGDGTDWYFDSAYQTGGSALIAKILNHSFVCGEYAFLSLFVCLILKDKFFTLSIFMVVNYFCVKLDVKFMNTVSLTDSKNRALRGLFPNNQTELYTILPSELHISFYWYIGVMFLLFAIITLISFFLIRRRYKYAS